MIIYYGAMFPKWQNNAFIGGLRSKSLVRIRIEGDQAAVINFNNVLLIKNSGLKWG